MTIKNLRNNKGFTIVETLIVLAIAAVIIIIILLAVPALQRTSRNTNIKTDATTLGGGVSEYESNNGGGFPTGVTFAAGSASWTGGVPSTTTISSGTIVSKPAPPSGTVTSTSYSYAGAPATGTCTENGTTCATVSPGHLVAVLGASCATPGTVAATQSVNSDSSSIAILYPIETSGAGDVGCYQN